MPAPAVSAPATTSLKSRCDELSGQQTQTRCQPPSDALRFGVLALGHHRFPDSSPCGKDLDAILGGLSAQRVVARVDCDGPFEGPLETSQDRLFDYSSSDTARYPGLKRIEAPAFIVVLRLSLATVPHRRGSIPAEPPLQELY